MCDKVYEFIKEALERKITSQSEFSAKDVYEWYRCMKQRRLVKKEYANFDLLRKFVEKNPNAKVKVTVSNILESVYDVVIKFNNENLPIKLSIRGPFRLSKETRMLIGGLKGVFSTDKGKVNLSPAAAVQHILSVLRKGERVTVFWSPKSGENPKLFRTISSMKDLIEFLNDIRKYLSSHCK